MLNSLAASWAAPAVSGQARRSTWRERAWPLGAAAIAALLGLATLQNGPSPALIGWLIYAVGALAILYRPRYGVYLIVFFSLLGDGVLMPWYPFNKNLSSAESLFFLQDALIVSPLEIYLVLTLASWLGRGALTRRLRLYRGPLFWPAAVFIGFIALGLAYGIGRHGNVNIALWEARPIFYLPLMLVLAGNLLETPAQVNTLLWAAMTALWLEGVVGNAYFAFTLRGDLYRVEAITEHSAAIHMNTLFVLLIASWLLRASRRKRVLLLFMAPSVLLTYLVTQRRAAFLTLAIALALIAIVLFRANRRSFALIVPPLAVLGVIYLVAFWHSTGALGLPAQAIRSVIGSDTTARYESSNAYRVIENINNSFTVHAAPLTGVGFGHKFYMIVPQPDISFFVWWEYITHNSVIWIWMQAGVGGFLSLLFLVGWAILVGTRALWRMPGGDLRAVALTATLYVIMHFTYAYVDMSWDTQSMVYLGAMMGILGGLEAMVKSKPAVGAGAPGPVEAPWL